VLKKYRLTMDDVRLAMDGSTGGRRGSKLRGKKLKPKYRNPADKSQTWAGRGIRPRWLVAALKSGKRLEDFLV
jgi:DNA-binding protein H-NS